MIVTVGRPVLLGGGIFLFLLLVAGNLLVAMLAVAATLIMLGGAHCLLWGRQYQDAVHLSENPSVGRHTQAVSSVPTAGPHSPNSNSGG
jgi:hypothetical protein